MKVLTIHNPWAWSIIWLGKDIENRSWLTHYRGPLAIHVSRRGRDSFYQEAYHMVEDIVGRGLIRQVHQQAPLSNPALAPSAGGHIIGLVDLVDVTRNYRSRWAQRGCYNWVLQNPRPVELVRVPGRQGLWDFDGELVEAVA